MCVGLQLLMPREVFCSSGGRFSGISLLLGPTRNTQRLLHLILRLVGNNFHRFHIMQSSAVLNLSRVWVLKIEKKKQYCNIFIFLVECHCQLKKWH